jgi:hypothetical protein
LRKSKTVRGKELQTHIGGQSVKPRTKKSHEIILRDGKPKAVILDIEEYQEMLERLEDTEDLKILAKIRERPLRFRKFEKFLREYKPSV